MNKTGFYDHYVFRKYHDFRDNYVKKSGAVLYVHFQTYMFNNSTLVSSKHVVLRTQLKKTCTVVKKFRNSVFFTLKMKCCIFAKLRILY